MCACDQIFELLYIQMMMMIIIIIDTPGSIGPGVKSKEKY